MPELTGNFDLHLTVPDRAGARLAAFAEQHDVTVAFIVLDRGATPAQPMLTIRSSGTLSGQYAQVERWQRLLAEAGIDTVRVKIEAAPDNPGVPRTDTDARAENDQRYFEHHVKLLLPGTADLTALTDLVGEHDARLSRNARRHRTDGRQERFATQRCHQVGADTARTRLAALTDALRAAGHEIVEVEQEYVVWDSAIELDAGWFSRPRTYPATYQPVPGAAVRQRPVFDPALKHLAYAYRTGEPGFDDPALGDRWRAARRDAMTHLLGLIAASPWGDRLVLRGSLPLRVWLGDAAREPGDLDFVVPPDAVESVGARAGLLFGHLVHAVRADPGPGLLADTVATDDLWTYERADGARLVLAFQAPQLPRGSVQVDVVLGEALPVPPVPLLVPPLRTPVPAAPPELALAWKLLWLHTDWFPQGKDLYDAVLLAEHTTVPAGLLRQVVGADFTVDSVREWDVDWANFVAEYPGRRGDLRDWLDRLVRALGGSAIG